MEEEIYLATDLDFVGNKNGEFRYIGEATKIEIPNIIKGVEVTSYRKMFEDCCIIEEVISNNCKIEDLSYMFKGANLECFDISGICLTNVKTMKGMFKKASCNYLYLNELYLDNVEDTSNMFEGAFIAKLELSETSFKKVRNTKNMFKKCLFFQIFAARTDLSKRNKDTIRETVYKFREFLSENGNESFPVFYEFLNNF